jgi:hypothetical protein
MHLYRAYSLTLGSDIELPGLDPAVSGAPDVRIIRREITREELRTGNQGGERIAVHFLDLIRFVVEGGHTISFDVVSDVEEEIVQARILGEIMAGLLRQRGLLVIHACAVEKNGEAIAFVGESGWGKSTLAEFLCQNGYRLLTDDVMALDGTHVIPSYPQIRLRADSADHFTRGGGVVFEAIARNGPKHAHNGVQMADSPVPLRSLYLLEAAYADTTSFVEIPAGQALMHLVAHTRAKTLVQTNAPDLLRQHLTLCADLVRAVQPRILRRRYSLDDLPAIQALVESDTQRPLGTEIDSSGSHPIHA